MRRTVFNLTLEREWCLNKVKGNLEKKSILCLLNFQRGIILGHPKIEYSTNEEKSYVPLFVFYIIPY